MIKKNNYTVFFALCFSFFTFLNSFSQNGFTTNNNELEELYDKYSLLYPSTDLFQDVKPYNRSDIFNIYYSQIQKDSLYNDSFSSTYLMNELSNFCIFSKKLYERKKSTNGIFYPNDGSLAAVDKENIQLVINPLLELKAGRETDNDQLIYTAFRGIELRGTLGGVVNFYGQLTENQLRPFQYIHQYGTGFNGQNGYNFNPYYTYWKDINNNNGYDFSNSLGSIEYAPSKHFSVMMGHDRNHYGYGYRSLFLGDNGAPYFQLKVNAYIWKFHYQALFAQFTGQYIRGGDRLLPKKYGAFHLFTYKPSKKLDIGLFEGIIFHRNDGFELNYLNPVIFYHSIEHSLGSSDNVLMGLQAKYNLNQHTQFYTQFLLDDLQVNQFIKGSGWWGNKYGIQLGSKFINIAKINQLDAQLELNIVRPFTYSHYSNDNSDTIDNFTHYNQPLAHPFGANFIELFGKLSYRPIPSLKIEAKFDYNIRGIDIAGALYGNNIFANTNGNTIIAEFDNKILQGNKITTKMLVIGGQYSLFHNIYWDLDIIYRNTSSDISNTSQSSIGFLTGLRINLRKRDYLF